MGEIHEFFVLVWFAGATPETTGLIHKHFVLRNPFVVLEHGYSAHRAIT